MKFVYFITSIVGFAFIGSILLTFLESPKRSWAVQQQDQWSGKQDKEFIHVRSEMVEISGQSYLKFAIEDWNFKVPTREKTNVVKSVDDMDKEIWDLKSRLITSQLDYCNLSIEHNKLKDAYNQAMLQSAIGSAILQQTNRIQSWDGTYKQETVLTNSLDGVSGSYLFSNLVSEGVTLSNSFPQVQFKSTKEATEWAEKNLKYSFHSNGVPEEAHQ